MLGPFLLFKLALSVPKCECPLALGLLAVTLSKVGLSYSARCHSTSPQKDLLCHHPPRPPSAMLRNIIIIMVIIIAVFPYPQVKYSWMLFPINRSE